MRRTPAEFRLCPRVTLNNALSTETSRATSAEGSLDVKVSTETTFDDKLDVAVQSALYLLKHKQDLVVVSDEERAEIIEEVKKLIKDKLGIKQLPELES